MRGAGRIPEARSLGRAEAFFWFMGQANCGNAMVSLELDGALDPGRLEGALRRLQLRHPLLRARIERRGLGMRLALEQDPPPIPLHAGESDDWRGEVAAAMDRPFPAGAAPLARCFVFGAGRPHTALALVFSHAVCDGLGSASLIRELLEDATAVAVPERPDLSLRPPLEQALRPTARGMALRFFAARAKVWLRQGVPRRVPGFRDVTHRRRDVRILERDLQPAETSELLKACRAERTTVNGALAAALLRALAEELPGTGAGSLAVSSPVDLRAAASPPIGRDEAGNYIGHVVSSHRVRPAPGFWDLAREFNASLRGSIEAGLGYATWIALPPPWSALPQGLWARFLCALMRVQPASAMLTNIGRLPEIRLAGGTRVRRLSFGLSPIFRDALALCASSHGGLLAMNLVFAASALPPKTAERVADRVGRALREASTGEPR